MLDYFFATLLIAAAIIVPLCIVVKAIKEEN